MNFPLKTSVRLAEAEAENAQKVAVQGTDEAAALAELTGIALGARPAAATTLHAVVVAGLKAIEDKALEIGYQREAEFMATDPECQAWRKAMRGRGLRRPFMDEAGAA